MRGRGGSSSSTSRRFPICTLIWRRSFPRVRVRSSFAGAPAAPTRGVGEHTRHWTKRERPRLYGDGGQEPKDRTCLGLFRQRAPTPATRRPSGLIELVAS